MNMTIYQQIRAAVPIGQAARRYGLAVSQGGMALCPFHHDTHPSLKLNEDYFFCFGCGATGDVIDFARADLQNMLVMVDDDMKMEALTQTNNIKAIVTAELPMDLEKKGQQSYQGDLRVRFLAFGNGTLQALHDRSFGFFRRQIILEARERSPNRRDDPYLADELCGEKEGIFLWALEGLQQLIRNDFQFTLSQRAKENMEAAVADGNNAVEFMKSQGYFRFKADAEVSSRDFYDVYRLWCEDNALNPLSQKSLTNYLKQNERTYNLEYTNKWSSTRSRQKPCA